MRQRAAWPPSCSGRDSCALGGFREAPVAAAGDLPQQLSGRLQTHQHLCAPIPAPSPPILGLSGVVYFVQLYGDVLGKDGDCLRCTARRFDLGAQCETATPVEVAETPSPHAVPACCVRCGPGSLPSSARPVCVRTSSSQHSVTNYSHGAAHGAPGLTGLVTEGWSPSPNFSLRPSPHSAGHQSARSFCQFNYVGLHV